MKPFLTSHKRTLYALLAAFLFSTTVTLAVPPTTPYTANETLDPNCGPSDTNCFVASDTLTTGTAGGQSVVGGTEAGETLTLTSTSNATKGKILFGTSAYDEVNNRLGINTSTNTFLGGNGFNNTALFAVKGKTANSSGYSISTADSNGNLIASFDNNGRLDLNNYSGVGGVMALRNYATSTNSTVAGHYAYVAKDNLGNPHTVAFLLSNIINNSSTAMSSQLDFKYMDDVDTVPGGVPTYRQPNKSVYINKYGLQLPNIPVTNYSGTELSLQNNLFVGAAGVGATVGTSTATTNIFTVNGTGKFYLNNTDTSTATHLLEQAGTGDATMQFLLTGGQRWQMGVDNSDAAKFKIGRGASWVNGTDISITGTGNVGFSTATPTSTNGGIDISSGGNSIIIGAENNANTRTNNQDKFSRIGSFHYTNAEEHVSLMFTQSSASASIINIGGGTGNMNAATQINFFTAANNITTTGTSRLLITSGGLVGIGSTSPSYLLHVGSSTPTGIVARFQNSTGTCDINPTTTALSCSSDMTLKKNIKLLSDDTDWSFNDSVTLENKSILSKILALTPVHYNWNSESDSDDTHSGFIAQDVQSLFPDLVTKDKDTNLLSLNYMGLLPYTISAIQEMDMNITDISDLTKENGWRDSLVAWFGSTSNGIRSLVVKEKLCVDDQCLTKDDVRLLLEIKNSYSAGSSQHDEDISENSEDEVVDSSVPSSDEPTPEIPVEEVQLEPVPIPESEPVSEPSTPTPEPLQAE